LPRFRAAYDFLLLRAASGEVPQELADWWTDFAAADGSAREAMLRPEEAPKKRRRVRRKPSASQPLVPE
jgi:poly(A) polymerase